MKAKIGKVVQDTEHKFEYGTYFSLPFFSFFSILFYSFLFFSFLFKTYLTRHSDAKMAGALKIEQ